MKKGETVLQWNTKLELEAIVKNVDSMTICIKDNSQLKTTAKVAKSVNLFVFSDDENVTEN